MTIVLQFFEEYGGNSKLEWLQWLKMFVVSHHGANPKKFQKKLDMTNDNKHKNKVKVKVVQDNNDDRYTKARPTTVG